ncbi:MAG: hypothetical protein HY033_12080 [Ignavibacteriae bacterium]|nr:hypothetical protein [Ignavibacteria bacterium]MBI3365631.1 hypothetical protein [Ignavibacteriota bacterium]
MIRRISMWYLWLLPIWFLILAGVYQSRGLTVLIVVGIFYFAAVVLAVVKNLRTDVKLTSTPSLAGLILTLGGAVVWLCGSAGPPDFQHPAVLFFNSGGLLAGHWVVLTGFVILTASFWDIANRGLLLLGFINFTVSTIFWLGQRMILWSIMSLAPGDPDVAAQSSELFRFLYQGRSGLALVYFVSGCLGTMAFGRALWKCGWIGNKWGTTIIVFSLFLAIIVWIMPLPPAVVYFFPYFIGLIILLRSNRAEPGIS